MGILAERLDSLSIETSSPDGQITGVFRPTSALSVHFRDGGYRGYTERGLERQLAALVASAWARYWRARQAAVAEATGEPAVPHQPWDTAGRRYRAERDRTRCEGMSAGHRVHVSHTGLRDWNVVVRDGTLSTLDEFGFAAELESGFTAAMRDHRHKLMMLRDKHLPR
ncbi:hypothetical protein [Stackebrandtia nassauensis]|uniref:Uncharacterized protein n=1 Tax=Stackebrandtia nassauensis (strain DSM 44728 / CIP 108903 / NRRL B-16338 / NBRC 102104 / LLR-40K-21) TaxID=446470 RepID=D3Q1I1_STANL|nr:hypothetical protein [Stackebrandtia nassauensis]ADD39829.1 hypothetical protein Snas_0108 [Stackebrandtia nassauensis DSM 44728]